VDGKIAALSLLARLTWQNGDLDAALSIAREIAIDIDLVDHALSTCYGLAIGAIPVAIAAGDAILAQVWLARLRDVTNRFDLDHWGSLRRAMAPLSMAISSRRPAPAPCRTKCSVSPRIRMPTSHGTPHSHHGSNSRNPLPRLGRQGRVIPSACPASGRCFCRQPAALHSAHMSGPATHLHPPERRKQPTPSRRSGGSPSMMVTARSLAAVATLNRHRSGNPAMIAITPDSILPACCSSARLHGPAAQAARDHQRRCSMPV
jgi:hypothetical protein